MYCPVGEGYQTFGFSWNNIFFNNSAWQLKKCIFGHTFSEIPTSLPHWTKLPSTTDIHLFSLPSLCKMLVLVPHPLAIHHEGGNFLVPLPVKDIEDTHLEYSHDLTIYCPSSKRCSADYWLCGIWSSFEDSLGHILLTVSHRSNVLDSFHLPVGIGAKDGDRTFWTIQWWMVCPVLILLIIMICYSSMPGSATSG